MDTELDQVIAAGRAGGKLTCFDSTDADARTANFVASNGTAIHSKFQQLAS
jgi:hypothetical protein